MKVTSVYNMNQGGKTKKRGMQKREKITLKPVKNGLSVKKKVKKPVKKCKKALSETTTDEFFNQDFNAEDSDGSNAEADISDEFESGDEALDAKSHMESLKNLKYTDPEFYKQLQKEGKELLEFNEDSADDEDLASDIEDEGKHVPNESLEVASDESDFEDENAPQKTHGRVTFKLLKSWEDDLQTDKSAKTIKTVVETFHAALLTVSDPDGEKSSKIRVDGGPIFNGVVQLCVLHLPAAFKKFLKIENDAKIIEVHKLKRFPKIRATIKFYLSDLLKILMNLSSPDILTTLLKHLHQMIPYTQSFSALDKPLLKILLKFWSSAEENVRIVAFLSILKIATTRKESVLETLFKSMYIKYVENAKFVSANSLPGINFMRHSLVEIYMLDHNLAYNHAFLYIRQLAIHLRNAMTLKKKDNFQAVYNWQYINSLRFWSELISKTQKQSMLQSLLYPLVQIIIGTIKLIPTAQFYPLRFHCVQLLIDLSKETGAYIPLLPFLLEILNGYDFNKKHKSVTMKPISFHCLLRMSKSQLQENGFKDSIIENIYSLILENAANESHTIYFPDLYVPCIVQLKGFLKKCKVANFCKKIKQLLEKIEENRKFVENERNKIIIDLSDMTAIKNWENQLKNQGTPLAKFYDAWYNLHQSKKLKLLTQNDQVGDFKLPSVKSKGKRKSRKDSDHDSDLDMPVEEMEKLLEKQRKNKKKLKKPRKEEKEEISAIDNGDIVKEMNIHDWD